MIYGHFFEDLNEIATRGRFMAFPTVDLYPSAQQSTRQQQRQQQPQNQTSHNNKNNQPHPKK